MFYFIGIHQTLLFCIILDFDFAFIRCLFQYDEVFNHTPTENIKHWSAYGSERCMSNWLDQVSNQSSLLEYKLNQVFVVQFILKHVMIKHIYNLTKCIVI